MVSNQLQSPVQMPTRLVVDAYPVGARLRKGRNVLIRILDHQVAIERKLCRLAQALDDRRPDGDVGDKMPVHHIDMDHCAAAALGRGYFVCQPCKIR